MAPHLQTAMRSGVFAGHVEAQQLTGIFPFAEEHIDRNDGLAAKGEAIIASGATWRGRKVSEILAGRCFKFTRKEPDPLTHIEQMRTHVHDIDPAWRRGFVVAIGLCECVAADSQEQQDVRLSLGKFNAQEGFDAGQYIQLSRTNGEWHQFIFTDIGNIQDHVEGPGHQDHDPAHPIEEARQQGWVLQRPEGGHG